MWMHETHNIGDIYPGLTMPDRYGHLVYYDMAKYMTRLGSEYGKPAIRADVRPKVGTLGDSSGDPSGVAGSDSGWSPPVGVDISELREEAEQEVVEALGVDLE